MKIKDLVQEIVKREGGKSNVKIGDVREIVGIVSDLIYESASRDFYDVNDMLYTNGKRRAKRKQNAR